MKRLLLVVLLLSVTNLVFAKDEKESNRRLQILSVLARFQNLGYLTYSILGQPNSVQTNQSLTLLESFHHPVSPPSDHPVSPPSLRGINFFVK